MHKMTLTLPAVDGPLSERAYGVLRTDILRGHIAPGEKLKIEALQRTHQFSSSPLREALNRLVAEGLVIADERRGFRAASVSLDDLRDMVICRVVSETATFAAAIRAGGDSWEAGVVSAYHRLELVEHRIAEGLAAHDDSWTAVHKSFHMALLAGCGSQKLLDHCSRMFDQAERYRRLSTVLRTNPRNTSVEHRRLMEVALRRDEDSAIELLTRHIEKTAKNVARSMQPHKGAK
jgi:GntR family carbon starvation induced transcriptional regulator